MFKRVIILFLFAGFICCSIMVAGCSRKDKGVSFANDEPVLTSKEMTVKSVVYAVVYNKSEMFWQCLTKDTQTLLLDTARKRAIPPEAAKKEFFAGYKKDFEKHMAKYDNNPEITANALIANPSYPVVEIEGKWYLNLEHILLQKKPEAAKMRSKINHTNKDVFMNTFFDGVIGADHNLVWECLSPKMQESVKRQKQNKDSMLEEIKHNTLKDVKSFIEKEFENNQYDKAKTIASLAQKGFFVKVGHRWYYQGK